MNQNHVKTAIQICIQANVPVIAWGIPGAGKTSFMEAVAGAMETPLEVVITSIREPQDFGGLPVINDSADIISALNRLTDTLAPKNGHAQAPEKDTGASKASGVYLSPPSWATRLSKAGKGIVFFDEISTAPPAVQAAMLRVTQDRYVGDLLLPDDVRIVAAANPPDQAAGGWDLAPPMANRFCHIDWPEQTAKEWADGMIAGWPSPKIVRLPDNWQEQVMQARTLIGSFMTSNPTRLFNLPKNDSEAGRAWASARSWDMACTLLGACMSVYGDFVGKTIPDEAMLLISGCVGDGEAIEFMQYLKALDLPDPNHLLKFPDKLELNDRSDRSFAILNSVSQTAIRADDPDKWHAAWFVLEEACKQSAIDVAASAAMSLVRSVPKGAHIPEVALDRFEALINGVYENG